MSACRSGPLTVNFLVIWVFWLFSRYVFSPVCPLLSSPAISEHLYLTSHPGRCTPWLCVWSVCDYVGQFVSNNKSLTYSGVNRKRRKSRTAFTNQQLFELERRFVRQKYISAVDRDHIASTVGITTAQVTLCTHTSSPACTLFRDFKLSKFAKIAYRE